MNKQERLDRINARMNSIMNSIIDLIVDVRALNEEYYKDKIINDNDYNSLEERLDRMTSNLTDKRGE